MVWYALRYREWLAGRSLTLPVFRAGVRGRGTQLLPSWLLGGGGGCCCALPIDLPVPPCSCLLCWPGARGPCAVRPCATQALRHAHWLGVLVVLHQESKIVGGLAAEPNGSARLSDPEALYKGARGWGLGGWRGGSVGCLQFGGAFDWPAGPPPFGGLRRPRLRHLMRPAKSRTSEPRGFSQGHCKFCPSRPLPLLRGSLCRLGSFTE